MKIKKNNNMQRRIARVRAVVRGTTERPRLAVTRSNQHIIAQVIDDSVGKTVAMVLDRGLTGDKTARAIKVGELLAEQLKAKGVTSVAFDRRGRKYHGRIKAVAEAVRGAGIVF